MPRLMPSAVVLAWLIAGSSPAAALPIFAQQYGVPCQKCHTAIPALNAFGSAFMNNGYHIPGAGAPPPVFPLAVKANVAYTSAPDPSGLPKAIVDEIELLTAGTVGSRGNYFAEQYVVDGGNHGNLREAWFDERLTPDGHLPIDLRAGQFTLPLPVDPESFRETAQHYAVFDQTVGANPFNFFDPKAGLALRFGDDEHGLTLDFAALQGHDVQSGLPSGGVDLMQNLHERLGAFDLTLYRYSGRRPVDAASFAPGDVLDDDRFTRTGFGLRFTRGRWTSESVLQQNTDTNVDGFGQALHSSGGFSQLRYAITPKLFGLARYDGTNDTAGLQRSLTALLGYRLTHNSRVTVEDVITHSPAAVHTLNAQFTVAY